MVNAGYFVKLAYMFYPIDSEEVKVIKAAIAKWK